MIIKDEQYFENKHLCSGRPARSFMSKMLFEPQ